MADIVALDQGTTSSRAIRFGADLVPQAVAQREFPQIYPRPAGLSMTPRRSGRASLPA